MTRRIGALSGPDEPAAPRARDAGAVLRGVALHHAPRSLPRPGASRGQPTRAAARSEDPRLGGPADAPRRKDPGASAGPDVAARSERPTGAGDTGAEARSAAEAEALRSGYQAGFERGREEGRAQGLAEGRDAGQEAVARQARAAQEATAARLLLMDQLVSSLPAELEARVAAAEDDLVALCHAAVCRILGDQLVTREGVAHVVRQAVREGFGGASTGGAVAIHLHPRDLEALRGDEHVSAWLARGASTDAAAIRWVADEEVGLGGCLVDSGGGTLDARLETQMEALRDLLRERGR